MINYEDLLLEAGFSQKAIEEVKAGKLHYGGSLDAASDKELSVKLAFHVKAKLENVAELFMRFPKKKEFDDAVIGLGENGSLFLNRCRNAADSFNFRVVELNVALPCFAHIRNDCGRRGRRFP